MLKASLAALLLAALAALPTLAQSRLPLDRVKLPPGFEISVFAEGVEDARSMAMGEKGTLFDKESDSAWGRPVDVQVMPDGALLVSDDHANVIYRISYRK